MYFTPTTWIVQLLVALQVLMTLVMPLTTTTTMALPVTSKPIESTAENLAWQAWIMLPPEQKQLIKSRKVTPKSIFTLPLRVECPEGHQQVDMKCIPTVIGSNAVLIDPNVLGLVLGDAPLDFEYDYEDEGGDRQDNMPYNPPLYLSDSAGAEKSNGEAVLELRPPSKDEPLKFNIFQSKFPTDDEYPMEDYSGVSNEGAPVQAESNQTTITTNVTVSERIDAVVNVTTDKDLLSEASNVSMSHTLTTLPESSDFNLDNLDAISLSASTSQEQNQQKFSLFKEDSSIHLVTSVMDTESTVRGNEEEEVATQQTGENDLETLLQTESLMPMLNHTTAATIMPAESLTLTTVSLDDQSSSSSDAIELHVEDEEMTTLPNLMDRGDMDLMEKQDKAEFIRSVTMNSLYSGSDDQGDDDEVTTLTPSTGSDEPSESEETTTTATTTIQQLDDTTIIESADEVSSTTPTMALLSSEATGTTLRTTSTATAATMPTPTPLAEELKELLLQQEQALQDFEELQRMRKGQKDQHTVLKKSKVEPVEVLSASPATATAAAAAAETMPTETTATMDELITAETVTPLLTAHNNENDNNDSANNNNNNNNNKVDDNNNNNDRFYYQHFAKQDLESASVSGASQQQKNTKATPETTTLAADIEALASTATATAKATSEIDLAEELRLINELVKGKRPGTTATTAESSSTTSDDASTSTSPSPSLSPSTTPLPSPSESSASSTKYTLETTKIWSKIMPLITATPKASTTTKATPEVPESSTQSSTTGETSSVSNEISSTPPVSLVVSNRSHRNSKIIRINGLNAFSSITNTPYPFPETTTTSTEDISIALTTDDQDSAASSATTSADGAYEPFWWLPVAWRLDAPSTTTKKPEQEHNSEEMPLLLRFWSTYHAPKSS